MIIQQMYTSMDADCSGRYTYGPILMHVQYIYAAAIAKRWLHNLLIQYMFVHYRYRYNMCL